jgi:hypothetical protein
MVMRKEKIPVEFKKCEEQRERKEKKDGKMDRVPKSTTTVSPGLIFVSLEISKRL